MAHFAKIENGIVTRVIVVSDSDCRDDNNYESEAVGQAFIASLGLEGEWKQTSYNANFRAKYAGIGDRYDAELDQFVSPVVEENA